MLDMRIKPVFIRSRGRGVFIEGDGGLDVDRVAEADRQRIDAQLNELKNELGNRVTVLDEIVAGDPADFDALHTSKEGIDIVLAYFRGVTPIENLLRWPGPIIAFSGDCTPAFALYAVGEERHVRKDLFIALDYAEMRRLVKVLEVKRSLADTRVLLLGMPPNWHLRWYSFPDLEAVRRKLGIQFFPTELRELVDRVKEVEGDKASALAREWMDEAGRIVEPSPEDIQQSAAVYLAMDQILSRKDCRAMAVNCLGITQSRRFRDQIINPCMAMTRLRDKGVPTACEMDVAGLLTMIFLENLSRKPSFLGNIVRADPESNDIKLSHCILPTRMRGFDQDPLPHTIRDFHGYRGVTAFTEVPAGETVTLARAHRNLDRIVALKGEVTACEDTVACRNTLTIQINDARGFVRRAEGNHHIAVFGDYLDDLKALCDILDCRFHEV